MRIPRETKRRLPYVPAVLDVLGVVPVRMLSVPRRLPICHFTITHRIPRPSKLRPNELRNEGMYVTTVMCIYVILIHRIEGDDLALSLF